MANETITGKIFQLKDPSNSYNRFPRTVMEAVYGLNTYLQNQFSALADIYMPIEGITESKPLQEFVYRACPSSIKAKSVSLDRIYGKTLAWNQLNNINDNYTVDGLTIAMSGGTLTVTGTAGSGSNVTLPTQEFTHGHKYLVKLQNDLPVGIAVGFYANGEPRRTSLIYELTSDNDWFYLCLFRDQLTIGQQYNVSERVDIIDLTLMFGAGNEPSTVEEFEAMFPGYHSYEPGKLISNDAESIETVGFNQWDEEVLNGYYEGSNGAYHAYSGQLCTKNRIRVISGETYYLKIAASSMVALYNDAMEYLGKIELDSAGTFTIPSGCQYIHLNFGNYGATYNHDICINLSDPAKNGTYEPYRKSTMQLNLDSFQVRDSQGNVATITGGLKSAGSVKDEIVGNKYIKRVGSVDLGSLFWALGGTNQQLWYAAFSHKQGNNGVATKYLIQETGDANSLTSGYINLRETGTNIYYGISSDPTPTGMLYYELATPIEYELAEPLVPTVAAGTTEARISPNSDGLSAPMVADMTYDAQANNDSASSQYALTAGRLLNSHKLWGQDFDGTQDVSGNMTGVGNISFSESGKTIGGLVHFDTSNGRVGIGAAPGAYKFDVSGTFRATGAVTLGSTLSVSGNTTLLGTLTVGTAQTNKATTLYGTLNATGATTLGSTLSVTGLTSIAGGLKLTTTKKIWFDDTHYIELLNGYLHTNLPIVSDSYITAGAVNPNA